MNQTIELMRNHRSIRRFTEQELTEEDLAAILSAGQSASSWKNFQSYSIIVIRSMAKKQALYDLVPQEALLQASVALLFIGDHYRASQAAQLHGAPFDARGPENLLISSVDAALAGQNTLLAAESLGYGGVFIGMVRHRAEEVAAVFELPAYTYPIFCLALGHPAQDYPVKPRLEPSALIFEESYQKRDHTVLTAYDQVQTVYAGERQTETWSERMVAQFSQAEQAATRTLLTKHHLL